MCLLLDIKIPDEAAATGTYVRTCEYDLKNCIPIIIVIVVIFTDIILCR